MLFVLFLRRSLIARPENGHAMWQLGSHGPLLCIELLNRRPSRLTNKGTAECFCQFGPIGSPLLEIVLKGARRDSPINLEVVFDKGLQLERPYTYARVAELLCDLLRATFVARFPDRCD
jgi:hypothetical protein